MNMRILFFGLTVSELKNLLQHKDYLELKGHEVAYATPDSRLLYVLTAEKALVVKPETYEADLCLVLQDKITPVGFKTTIISEDIKHDELEQVIKNEFAEGVSSNDDL